jgi:hypothetical protein
MDVLMPDGTLVTGVPEGVTQSDLLARYSKFSASKPTPAAPTLSPEEQVMGAATAPATGIASLRKPSDVPEMTPYTPSLTESLMELIPGNKAKAANEYAARKAAEERGVSPEEIYKGAGGARPMLNPEGRAPVLAGVQAGKIVASEIPKIPGQLVSAGLQAYRAGDIGAPGQETWVDKTISAMNPETPAGEQDKNYDAFQGLSKSMGFSLASMIGSIVGETAGSVAGPLGAVAGGMGASGAIAYRASKDDFLSRLRDKLNQESLKLYSKPISKDDWNNAKQEFDDAASSYGAWEAIPEAISNAIMLKAFTGPARAAAGAGRLEEFMAKHNVAEKAASLAAEHTTETLTNLGQNAAELKAGLTTDEMDLVDAFKQQFLQTLLMGGVMEGGTKATHMASQFYRNKVEPRIAPGSSLGKAIMADLNAVEFSQSGINKEVIARLNPQNYEPELISPEKTIKPKQGVAMAPPPPEEPPAAPPAPPKEPPPTPPAPTNLAAAPSESMDTEAMLREALGEKPTVTPVTVEEPKAPEKVVEPEGVPSGNEAPETKQAEAQGQQAPAAPAERLTLSNLKERPIEEQKKLIDSAYAKAPDAVREGRITQEQYDRIESEKARIDTEYKEKAPKKTLTPFEQKISDLADQIESAGEKGFADAMRGSLSRGIVKESSLPFYQEKLQEFQAKQGKTEAKEERFNWSKFLQPNEQKYYDTFQKTASPEAKAAFDKVSSSIQDITTALNNLGYQIDDKKFPLGLGNLKTQYSNLLSDGLQLLSGHYALENDQKRANPEKFNLAIKRAKDSAAQAQQLIRRAVPKPEEVAAAETRVAKGERDISQIKGSPKLSLWSALTGKLGDSDMAELFGKKPQLYQKKLKAKQGGKSIADMVSDGDLDEFLPYKMRSNIPDFDGQAAEEYIKDKMRSSDYIPYDAQIEIEQIFGSVKDAEELINDYLTVEEQNLELQKAADEQREGEINAREVEPEREIPSTEPDEGEALTRPTPEGLRAKEEYRNKAEAAEAAEAKANKEAEDKAKADREVGEFTLTGSNRAADVAAARGQKDLLAQEEEPKALDFAEGDRILFTPSDARKYGEPIEGIAVQIDKTQGNNYRIKIRTDEAAPQGGGNITRTVYSQDGTISGQKEEAPAEPAKPEPVETPEGGALRYPLASVLFNDGYKVLALDDPRSYVDKGGESHRTFEKDGVRISFTPQLVLFQNRNSVITARGESSDLTVNALLVDQNMRGKGAASKALDNLTKAADQYGVTLYIEPVPIIDIKEKNFGLDRQQLENLYKKFGFDFAENSSKVMVREPEVEVLGPAEKPAAPQLKNEPYTIEGDFTEIGEEKQHALLTDQTSKLSEDQTKSLESQYGAKRGTDKFIESVRKDVIAFITEGAKAVNGKIRAIIRQLANGVLSVAIVFNPQFVSKPYTIAVPQYDITTSEVIKDLPKEAQSMSDAAKRAYGVIYPALEKQLKEKDKLFIVADKRSGNTYLFNPDGSLLLQSKTLFGKAIGDYMHGDNEIVANRITPAGVFDLGLRDAKRSAGEAYTAGDYDFGKVFVLDKSHMGSNGPYSNTIMHSVWTHETDAKQRLAALEKPGAEDSRYSFGCINVNKETFKYLITNHLNQMDGAKIFIVPENGANVMDFINGKAMYSDDIIRQKVEPVTKTTVTEKKVPAPKAEVERKISGRETEANKLEVKTEEEAPSKEPKEPRKQNFYSLEVEQTNTPAFKRWFGKSKMVDATGKPMVFYHGTSADINQFRLAKSVNRVGNPDGFYFTPYANDASRYAGEREGSNVMPVYLKIDNPFLPKSKLNAAMVQQFEKELRKANPNLGDSWITSKVNDFKEKASRGTRGFSEIFPSISFPSDAMTRVLTAGGYDGFTDGAHVIAIKPEQIKSAIGNIGTFDENNPDIRYSMEGYAEQEQKKRSDSLKRTIKTLNRMRKDGRITDEQFVERADAAIAADEDQRLNEEPSERKRGFLHIQKRLNEAVLEGDMSREARDLATWFMANNEDLVSDLGVSIIGKGKPGQSGQYKAYNRIMTVIKNGGSDLTTVHEILHHLERMMPTKIQQAIRKAWSSQLAKAAKAAKTPNEKLYFAALMDAHYGDGNIANIEVPKGAEKTYQQIKATLEILQNRGSSEEFAMEMLKLGLVPMANYEYVNPSEFWAVNGSDIVKARYDAVKGGVLARLKNWLKELGQKIKSIFGLKSDASIIRALDSLAKSDGEFVSKDMLGQGDYLSIKNYQGNAAPTALWSAPDKTLLTDLEYQLVDKQVDTKQVIEQINKTVGIIDERLDAYTKESLYHGRAAERIKDFLEEKLRPLFEQMKKDGVTQKQLEEYLHNRHAEERNDQINKINFSPDVHDKGSGIDTADARAYLAGLSTQDRAKLNALAARVDDIIKGTQKTLVDNGLETQETIDTWNKTYKHYIPLQRDDLDFVHTGSGYAGGYGTKGSASKRAVGSIKPVKDILANIAIQREKAIRRGEQARVGRALYALAITNPNPKFWLPINPNAIKDRAKLTQEMVSLGLTIQDADNLIKPLATPQIDKVTGLVKYAVNQNAYNSENVFPVRINGEDRFIIFNPNDERAKRMAQSLKNLDADQLGWALGTMGQVTRWISSINTQYNPVFGAWNMARDVGSAAFNLSTTEIAGHEKEVLKGTLPAMAAIWNSLRGKPASSPEQQRIMDDFDKMRLAGGTTGYAQQFSQGRDKANVVEKEFKRLNQGNARKTAQALFNWLSDYNDAMENAVRLSAFRVAQKEGLSEDKSASIAKELTVNFNRKGASAPTLQALYSFINASIQGTRRLAQTLRGPMGKKIIAGGITLGVIQAVALALNGYDDGDPPEFLKDKNFIIPIPFMGENYLIAPMPPGLNIFPGIGRIMTEAILIQSGLLKSNKGMGDKAISVMSLILDSFNPLGAGSLAQQLTPTAFDPLMAAFVANRDAFGRPIYKEDHPTAPTPGYERSRPTATVISQGLAEFMNWASSPSGTKHTKGFLSPTADQIDYLAGQYFGGVGREVIKAGAAVGNVATGEETPSYRIPIVGKLYGETKTPAAISSKFYDNVIQMSEYEHEIKMRQKNKESTTEYLRDNPEARLWQDAKNVERQVTKLNKTKADLLAKNKKDEANRIDKQKVDAMRRFNEKVKAAQ